MENIKKARWKILLIVSFCIIMFLLVRLIIVEKELKELRSVPPVVCPEIDPQATCGVPTDKESTDADKNTADNNSGEKSPVTVVKKSDTYSFSIPVTASFYNTFADSAEIAELQKETGNKRLGELLSAHVARNLVFSLDMRKDVYPGDQISVVFRTIDDKERAAREDSPDEIEILSIKYKSVRLGKELYFYSFKPAGNRFSAFYDEKGVSVEKHLKNSPLKEWSQITSLLRDRRPKHDGIDFKTPVGSPVYAPFSGKVLKTNWKMKYNGTSVLAELETNPKVYMILLHLDKLYVKNGQSFKAGEHIADTGNSGRSFAPHLHYQLQKEPGKTRAIIDPLKYHQTFRSELKKSDQAAFEERKKELNSLMK